MSVDVNTLMKGKKELLAMATEASLPTGKQRRPGGGRKKKGSSATDSSVADNTYRKPSGRKPNG